MYRKVLVTFLKTIILADIVQVVTPDHDRPLHFHLQHYASQDSSTNAHIASKRAFLVNIVTLNSLTTIRTNAKVTNRNITLPTMSDSVTAWVKTNAAAMVIIFIMIIIDSVWQTNSKFLDHLGQFANLSLSSTC